jgi:hypothetical protein
MALRHRDCDGEARAAGFHDIGKMLVAANDPPVAIEGAIEEKHIAGASASRSVATSAPAAEPAKLSSPRMGPNRTAGAGASELIGPPVIGDLLLEAVSCR